MEPIRVLFADDDERYRQLLERFLGLQPDITVVGSAADGEEAVQLYEELEPDVVVMDLSMPVMDGFASTRTIKSSDPNARVIVLTVYAGEENRKKSEEAGAVAYVSKADAAITLAPTIRDVAGRSSSQKPH